MSKLTISDVRAHPGDSAFLIDDGRTAILYDTGFGFTGYAVAEKIREKLGRRKLDYIFLTHSHYDHALGTPYILTFWPQAKVVAGAYAAKIFQKDSARAVMRDLDRKFAAKCGVTDYEDRIHELKVDLTVTDGDRIRAGSMDFMALELPGHTRCSVGYYCPEHKLLLNAESIGVYGGEGTVLPAYLVGYELTLSSIRKVEGLDIDWLLMPHYGLLDRAQSRDYLQKARQSAVETAMEICAILKAGGSLEQAQQFFKDKFYHGDVCTVYPIDAMDLNSRITVELLQRELLPKL